MWELTAEFLVFASVFLVAGLIGVLRGGLRRSGWVDTALAAFLVGDGLSAVQAIAEGRLVYSIGGIAPDPALASATVATVLNIQHTVLLMFAGGLVASSVAVARSRRWLAASGVVVAMCQAVAAYPWAMPATVRVMAAVALSSWLVIGGRRLPRKPRQHAQRI